MKLSDLQPRPTYSIKLPSTGKMVKYMPFSVRDERALLVAQESDDTSTILNTLVSVIKNCCVDTLSLSTFDVEFLFMHIRAKSVGEISTLNFLCECEETTPVSFDITKVAVQGTNSKPIIKLNSELSVKMKYIGIDELLQIDSEDDTNKILIKTIASSIDSFIKSDEIIQVKDEPIEDIIKFLDDLPSKEFQKLRDFIDNSPTVALTVPWTCPACKKEHSTILSGINSFF